MCANQCVFWRGAKKKDPPGTPGDCWMPRSMSDIEKNVLPIVRELAEWLKVCVHPIVIGPGDDQSWKVPGFSKACKKAMQPIWSAGIFMFESCKLFDRLKRIPEDLHFAATS